MVDPLVKPSGGVATAKAVPGSRLVMYPDMGHDLPRARWPELIAEIRRNADRAAVSVD
jgi:pimeloyl-ACP methyl ester carboxylesterase